MLQKERISLDAAVNDDRFSIQRSQSCLETSSLCQFNNNRIRPCKHSVFFKTVTVVLVWFFREKSCMKDVPKHQRVKATAAPF